MNALIRSVAFAWMRPRSAHSWLIAFVAVACAASAWAHDPYEITADARTTGDRLELVVTMAKSTALATATGAKEAPTFEATEFEKLRPKFLACAPRLFELGAVGRHPAPDHTAVMLTREEDVEFTLSYSVPAAKALRFKASLLRQLPYGYGVVLRVTREREEPTVKLLSAQDAELEVAAPTL